MASAFVIGLLFTTIIKTVGSVKNGAMDMEVNSLDDQYLQCHEEMLRRVLESEGLLETELQANPKFATAWEKGKTCAKSIPGGKPEHGIAIAAYTCDKIFYVEFNRAMSSAGTNTSIYISDFQYKSLHFLLNDAGRLLGGSRKCQYVDSGSHKIQNATQIGAEVRLGHFACSSPSLLPFCNTLYLIKTCHAVNIREYSCFEDIDMLMSPSEVFLVEAVTRFDNGRVNISLTSSGMYTRHDCFFSPRSPSSTDSSGQIVSSSWLVLLSASLTLRLREIRNAL
ncbi:hypothetical protein AAFF_G00323410 [Aldrovandia affinis]|uniref:NAD(P)(+)--arginine ADP-ribosyltransferase n=1 Tax=Aldrovandia affinis TaxID=143900 RepID=A0AAD7VZK4_9TELE|nr:hypothetical protein AAFF_G00323410 [Aldrovandia affinis]